MESAITGSVIINKIGQKIPHVDEGSRLKLMQIVEKEKRLFILSRSFETFEYLELGTSKKIVRRLKTTLKLDKPRYVML